MNQGNAESGKGVCALILLCSLILNLGGCSFLKQIRAREKTEEKTNTAVIKAETTSRLDSLTGGAVAVDTLVMHILKTASDTLNSFEEAKLEYPASLRIEPGGLVSGYRVQIASSLNKKDLDRLVERVEREFQVKSHIENYSGRWSLRVGDCQNRQEAENLRQQAVNFGFKYAWIVQANVKARF